MQNGRVVIVTGANNGIDLGLVKALATAGDKVACFDLSGENLAGLTYICCDVTDTAQVGASIAQVVSLWGRVDILVNNACLAIFAPFEEKPLSDTRCEFEVNYFGYVNMIGGVLPAMKAQRSGIIAPESDPAHHDGCSAGKQPDHGEKSQPRCGHPRNYTWAELMKRVWEVDVLGCDHCGTRMRILAAINTPEAAKAILECLGLPSRAPPISPALRTHRIS